MKIQSVNKSVNKTQPPSHNLGDKYEPVCHSLKNNHIAHKTTILGQQYRKSSRHSQDIEGYGAFVSRKSWSSIHEHRFGQDCGNLGHIPQVRQQDSKKVFRFSDFKKQQNGKSGLVDPNLAYKMGYRCQNHPKRASKFYITTKNPDQQSQHMHSYCLTCSINLSKMNFNIQQLPTANPTVQPLSVAITKLIRCKNALNTRAEQVKNQDNLDYIQMRIKAVEEKYRHIGELLDKIKEDQIGELVNMRIRVMEFVNQEEIKLAAVVNKVQYYIGEFGNMLRSEEMRPTKQKTPKKIHQQSVQKLQKQTQSLCKNPPMLPLSLPPQQSFLQITKKLQNLFTETVHSLSFQHQQKQQKLESSVQVHNQSLSEPEIKLRKYLFNQGKGKHKGNDKGKGKGMGDREGRDGFNQTFGNLGVVEGIDFVLSESGSFFGQENVRLNF